MFTNDVAYAVCFRGECENATAWSGACKRHVRELSEDHMLSTTACTAYYIDEFH